LHRCVAGAGSTRSAERAASTDAESARRKPLGVMTLQGLSSRDERALLYSLTEELARF
jgi:hypothetical protein